MLAQCRASALLWFPPRKSAARDTSEHSLAGHPNTHRLGCRAHSLGLSVWERGAGPFTGAKTAPYLTALLSLVVLAIALMRSCLLVLLLCDDSNPIMVCTLALACASDDRGRLGSILGDGRTDSQAEDHDADRPDLHPIAYRVGRGQNRP